MLEPVEFVRPTKRALDDLGIALPDLDTRLHELEHPVVMKAQQVPDRAKTYGAERIKSLTDRVWFKVKTADWRAAAGELPRLVETIPQTWWLAAAGPRVADSSQHDFYERLKAEAHRSGPKTCSSDALLPSDWDRRRLVAEAGANAQRIIQQQVRHSAGASLLNGDVRGFDLGDRNVRIRVKMLDDGQAYLGIGATGSIDHTFMVCLLSSIPGVDFDDWMPEPSEVLGLEPAPGEVLWSTMVSPDAQTALMATAQRDW